MALQCLALLESCMGCLFIFTPCLGREDEASALFPSLLLVHIISPYIRECLVGRWYVMWTLHHYPLGETRRDWFKPFCLLWASAILCCAGRLVNCSLGCRKCRALVGKSWGWRTSEVLVLLHGRVGPRRCCRGDGGANLKTLVPQGLSRFSTSTLMMSLAIFGGFLKALFPSVLWLSDNVVCH